MLARAFIRWHLCLIMKLSRAHPDEQGGSVQPLSRRDQNEWRNASLNVSTIDLSRVVADRMRVDAHPLIGTRNNVRIAIDQYWTEIVFLFNMLIPNSSTSWSSSGGGRGERNIRKEEICIANWSPCLSFGCVPQLSRCKAQFVSIQLLSSSLFPSFYTEKNLLIHKEQRYFCKLNSTHCLADT